MIGSIEPQPVRWLERMREGDAEAFDLAFDYIYEKFKVLARRHRRRSPTVAGQEATEDLYHEALLTLFRRYRDDRGRVPGDLDQLHRDVAQKVGDARVELHRRHEGPRSFARNHAGPYAGEPPVEDQTSASRALERREHREILHEAIEKLPARLQAVVRLKHWDGEMTLAEIAEILDVSTATVARDLARAHIALRELVPDAESWR